jgi:small subunit ribosomal protein S6
MAKPAPTYDLVVLLEATLDDDQKKKILSDVEAMISAGGEIVSEHDWGTRTLAFEIRHKSEAEYHLLQFHGPPELLANLQRTLRIADGVVRFRLIKLAPGTPAPPEQQRPDRSAAEASDAESYAPAV